jgi:hypothetical protein
MAFVELDNVPVTFPERSGYRQVTVNFGVVHICALGQQELGQLKVISLARHNQRGDAGLVVRIIEHGSLIEQELGDRDAAGIGSRVQRGEAARIPGHDVSPLAQERFHNDGLIGEYGRHERCRLIARPAIDTRARGQRILYRCPIAGGDSVEQRISCSGHCRRKHQRKNCQESAHGLAVSRVREVHKELMNHQPHPTDSSISVQIKCVRLDPGRASRAAGSAPCARYVD